jgi:septal ring factor EnvC (AmiA/AmiB activator)
LDKSRENIEELQQNSKQTKSKQKAIQQDIKNAKETIQTCPSFIV